MVLRRKWAALCIALCLIFISAAAENAEGLAKTEGRSVLQGMATESPETTGIELKLIPKGKTAYTNVLQHYVYFDAEVRNAESLTVRVYNPRGEQVAFRTKYQVDRNYSAVKKYSWELKQGQTLCEDMNIHFRSDALVGTWRIEVTASGRASEPVTQTLEVQISAPELKTLPGLGAARALVIGLDNAEPVAVEEGKVRFIAQNPKDECFVKEYWYGKAYDLRTKANAMCTRAVFSMALSWLGIDCTPVGMSDLMRTANLFYTYDEVCDKLGNVTRITGDLETLWAKYEAGEASPVLLHFKYTGGGMHAVLLIARDEENPELFYAVSSSTNVNTVEYGDGRNRDVILPLIIENGEEGQKIQSPLLAKYHKGWIDQIWSWAKR